MQQKLKTYYFLESGGEMGELTRSFDWSKTSIGTFSNWPHSLRTTLGIVLHSDFPMFLWWGDEMIQFYNDAYRPSLGHDGKHPRALGQHARECWPEIWEIIYPLIQQVRTTGRSFFAEDQLIPIFRNGKIEDVYWTFSYSPVIGDTGSIDGVLVVCNETTKKVSGLKEIERTQKLLLESENNLRSIILQAPVAMCIFKGPQHIVEIANERMFELWGRAKERLLHKPIFDVLPEIKNQGFEELLDQVYSTGETYSAYGLPVTVPRNRKVETIYINFVYEAFREGNGTIAGIMAVATDVTEQVIASKKIKESEQRYSTLITESTVAIALYMGRELRIQYVNEIMTKYWGKDLSIVGQTFKEAVPELKGQPFFGLMEKVYDTGQQYTGTAEEAELLIDGTLQKFYFNYTYKALRNSDGEIYGIHHMATDVTEQVIARQKIEELVEERTRELKRANESLRKSNAELSQFAYITSHDLQEPARKICVFSEMLHKSLGDTLDPRSEKYLRKIENSSTRMLALIRDVLTFSQVSKEKNIFEKVDLNVILESVKNDFELMIEQKGCIIKNTRLPVIEAIPLQMNQLFSNLISNALKFISKDKAPVLTITSGIFPRHQIKKHSGLNPGTTYSILSFTDNGIGFDQSNANQIFDIFQRLHAKAEFEGTGIGLAMCKKIAENHHGIIYAVSNPGEGATFNIILPVSQGTFK